MIGDRFGWGFSADVKQLTTKDYWFSKSFQNYIGYFCSFYGSVAISIKSVYYCARFYVSEFAAARKPPLVSKRSHGGEERR